MRVRRMSLALALAGVIVGSTQSAEAAGRRGHRFYAPRLALGGYFYSPLYFPYLGYGLGPYFTPYAGRFFADSRPIYTSLRLMIEPSDADVYVSGQHVGRIADFNGLLQRLTIKPGVHEIVLYREGYRTVRQTLDLQPGAEQKIRFAMQPLAEGESAEPPPAFKPKEPVGGMPKIELPRPAAASAVAKDIDASGFGELVLNIMPRPDEVLIDGERWPLSASDDPSLLFHLGAGKRRIEVRKAGHETFRTEVQVKDGERQELNVSLPKR